MGLADRVRGVLLGLAAGDQIGGPVRMALRVAESLCNRAMFDPHDIGERYLQWWREGAFDTGPTVARVLALRMSGISFEHASEKADREVHGMTAGCNPAHRSAPLSMLAAIDDSQLSSAARIEAALTHWHPLAGDVSGAVVVLCRALIRGVDWPNALALASEGYMAKTLEAIEDRSAKGLLRSGFAPDALRAAIHFVDTSESFAVALQRSIQFAGRANYCPVLVGSIAGARWGASQIEMAQLAHHEPLVPQLRALGTNLARGWMDTQA